MLQEISENKKQANYLDDILSVDEERKMEHSPIEVQQVDSSQKATEDFSKMKNMFSFTIKKPQFRHTENEFENIQDAPLPSF